MAILYLKGVDTAALLAENKKLQEFCSLLKKQVEAFTENTRLQTELVDKQAQQILLLQDQVAQLQRMLYGRKSERFIYQENQLSLFGNPQLEQPTPSVKETIVPTHSRKINKNHPGRSLLKKCGHLRVEEQHIETPHDKKDILIGHLQREKLAYKPGEFFIKKLITPKYKKHNTGQIVVGKQPSEPIPKCEADVSLLSYIVVSKFVDHLPENRQQKIFKRAEVVIPPSTMNGWTHKIANLFAPTADYLQRQILSTGYIQMDESTIRVLNTKKGKAHLGYMWVIYSPAIRCVSFIYHKGRSKEAPRTILSTYKGKVQSDGYSVYESLKNENEELEFSHCNAHARREFEKALSTHKDSASIAMRIYQKLYKIEAKINERRDDFADLNAFYAFRSRERQSMKGEIEALRSFVFDPLENVLPKSLMGKAIMYVRKRWKELTRFMSDGEIEMDTNLVENCIRPLALGRKNYLFAGNHKAATNIGVFYTIFNTCRHLKINAMDYTKWYLERIGHTKINEIHTLSPLSYKKSLDEKVM